eukprot:SAG31_NODE_29005_length_402_cov_0.854785_1_plen_100_part_01
MSHGNVADADVQANALEKLEAEHEILAAGSRMLAGKRAHDAELDAQCQHDPKTCPDCSAGSPCEYVGLRQRLAGRRILMVGEGTHGFRHARSTVCGLCLD